MSVCVCVCVCVCVRAPAYVCKRKCVCRAGAELTAPMGRSLEKDCMATRMRSVVWDFETEMFALKAMSQTRRGSSKNYWTAML